MASPFSILRSALLLTCAAVAAGCASSASATPMRAPAVQSGAGARSLRMPAELDPLRGPVVLAVDQNAHKLEYWPLTAGRHPMPARIDGIGPLTSSGNIAANGQLVAIPNANEIIVVNLQTKSEIHLPDAGGYPVDVAIGRDGTLYATNLLKNTGNVMVYPPNAKQRELNCALLQNPDYIAVDNEGDIFVNQNGRFTGVVEIPNGPGGLDATHCTALKLSPGVSGYAAGIAIDPKTDDLLVLDDPDYCAGGIEGRLTIYHKPYLRGSGRSLDLGQNCSGGLRLNADSTVVLIGDEAVDGPPSFILEHSYPDGKFLGAFGGGNPGGFTTIPNTLPN